MGEPFAVVCLGVRFKFPENKADRAREAVQLVQERYAKRAERTVGGSDKVITATVALGLAEEVLQLQKEVDALKAGITSTLKKIEEFE